MTLVDLLYEVHTLTPGAVKLCVSAQVPPHELFLPLLGAAGAVRVGQLLTWPQCACWGVKLRHNLKLKVGFWPGAACFSGAAVACDYLASNHLYSVGESLMCALLLVFRICTALQGVNPNLGRSGSKLDVKALVQVGGDCGRQSL